MFLCVFSSDWYVFKMCVHMCVINSDNLSRDIAFVNILTVYFCCKHFNMFMLLNIWSIQGYGLTLASNTLKVLNFLFYFMMNVIY